MKLLIARAIIKISSALIIILLTLSRPFCISNEHTRKPIITTTATEIIIRGVFVSIPENTFPTSVFDIWGVNLPPKKNTKY